MATANRRRHLSFQILAAILGCLDVVAQTSAPPTDLPEHPRPKIERLGDGRLRLGKIEFNQEKREIALDAKVNMNVGYLEYILVNEVVGKLHESLLTTQASPLNLNVVLLLLGFEASAALESETEDKAVAPQATASLDVLVRWQDDDGKQQEAHVEDWVYNPATDAPAVRGHWLYTGSKLDGYGGFAAETDGSFIAVYRDYRALLNNPREGKTSDEIWKPSRNQGLPAKNTPVRVIMRPHPVPTPNAGPGRAPES